LYGTWVASIFVTVDKLKKKEKETYGLPTFSEKKKKLASFLPLPVFFYIIRLETSLAQI